MKRFVAFCISVLQNGSTHLACLDATLEILGQLRPMVLEKYISQIPKAFGVASIRTKRI